MFPLCQALTKDCPFSISTKLCDGHHCYRHFTRAGTGEGKVTSLPTWLILVGGQPTLTATVPYLAFCGVLKMF